MMRFEVHVFPSLYGTPWKTDSRGLAYVYALLRFVANPLKEIRIIDSQTNTQIIVW
jgi:hypothetical protein